jgi:MATE family multidrug resistance protein
MQVDPAAVSVATAYLKNISWGLPGLMGFFVFRYLAEGMGFTRPTLIIGISMLVIKVPLNFVFMYGWLGAPALGGAGCGVSMAIINWLQLAAMVFVVGRARFDITGWRDRLSMPRWDGIRPLIQVGAPIGATLFFEVGLFSVTTLLLGRFGSEAVASHTIAMNLGGMAFMLPLALGMASTIRIGFNIGAGDPALARHSAIVAMKSSVAIAVVAAAAIVLFRHQVAGIYTTQADVLALAASLMLFVAAFQLFDATQATALGALRGYKDTRIPMVITLFSYWAVGLPIGCILGFGYLGEPMGIYGFWVGLVVGLAVVAALMNYRLWSVSNRRRLG